MKIGLVNRELRGRETSHGGGHEFESRRVHSESGLPMRKNEKRGSSGSPSWAFSTPVVHQRGKGQRESLRSPSGWFDLYDEVTERRELLLGRCPGVVLPLQMV